MAPIIHLECTKCGAQITSQEPQTVCRNDGGVLFVCYDLTALKPAFTPDKLFGRVATMWRYAEVLPEATPVSLGEGFTAMLRSREYANVYIKDEGQNPTGSFKARGLSAAVTMARAYGLKELAIPSAGNAASALAAYSAAAGLRAHIFMPRDVPLANCVECESYGAQVTLVDGLISDCARLVAEQSQKEGWFDVSTLKEPFRLEGKKTMGYEVVEQLEGRVPQGIIYPTGGGVGLIGMGKAFDEMQELGWIGPERPHMVAVQAAGCAPVVKAWDEGKTGTEPWRDASTLAAGLRVPSAYGDYLILELLNRTGGVALAVTDQEIMEALEHWAQVEGLFAAPEGAAALAAYRKLRASGFFTADDTVVLFNTGSGLKYLDVIETTKQPVKAPVTTSRQIGGIIGPY